MALLPFFISSVPTWSQQTADDIEKTIAALPADQRIYERFRYWINTLPPNAQQDPKLAARIVTPAFNTKPNDFLMHHYAHERANSSRARGSRC